MTVCYAGAYAPAYQTVIYIIVSMRHLVYVTLCRWPSAMQEHMLLHTRRSSTQSDINHVSHWYNNSPDDGHMAARNMYRIETNIHEKMWARFIIYRELFIQHRKQWPAACQFKKDLFPMPIATGATHKGSSFYIVMSWNGYEPVVPVLFLLEVVQHVGGQVEWQWCHHMSIIRTTLRATVHLHWRKMTRTELK